MNNLFLTLYVKLQNLMNREEGQDLVEYALLVCLVALAAIAGVNKVARRSPPCSPTSPAPWRNPWPHNAPQGPQPFRGRIRCRLSRRVSCPCESQPLSKGKSRVNTNGLVSLVVFRSIVRE